ncbi:flagellar biosynthetic protein FliR [Pseudohoeflea coraliihabitans]|uniref:Flagellar biosynthetic protein FliR n=1 Tax=Pseudohoeflea coraliihabitans TaxID=2860393 RepID=A0ABS6WN23_9HYPH|nr:flagellar biosynthetic protein FliR [Pseudohoeflea sp. DP4N28-3]MBW3097346.1 flagellar type III secretion system protein FliR [Pseudohoeflea sp. DP4N28-3]
MIEDPQGSILAVFAAFCRIGGCLMVLPGFSSFRVPVQVRLFTAVALSMALTPLLWDTLYPRVQDPGAAFIFLVASELLIGVTFGLIARFIVLALQFAGTSIQMVIGFNMSGGMSITEGEQEGQLTALITLTGLLVLFMVDFHHVVIRTLVASYNFMPLGSPFAARHALVTLTDTLAASFLLMLRLSSPFILFGLIFNVAIGLVNKLAPQIPIYFISIPFILTGGLILFYFGAGEFFTLFLDAFAPLYAGRAG